MTSTELSAYRDQQFKGSRAEQEKLLLFTTTLYIGNLSFYTTEEQIYELFSKCGDVKKVVMGLDKFKKTPCGFCFVEYYTREESENAMRYINGTRLDDRIIRTDWDAGFKEGRQFGRGKSGGQVRDEYRTDYDTGRGGYAWPKKGAHELKLEGSTTHPPHIEDGFKTIHKMDDQECIPRLLCEMAAASVNSTLSKEEATILAVFSNSGNKTTTEKNGKSPLTLYKYATDIGKQGTQSDRCQNNFSKCPLTGNDLMQAFKNIIVKH